MLNRDTAVTLANGLDSITSVTFVVTVDDLKDGRYEFSLDLFTMNELASRAATFSTSEWDAASLAALVDVADVTIILKDSVTGASVGYQTNSLSVNVGSNSVSIGGSLNVPEPTTTTLSLLALVGLAARRRRK